MVVKSSSVDLESLDLAYLALFVGHRVNEMVVVKAKAKGHENVRESHGYVIQHLIDRERSITDLARRMEVTQQAASKSVTELIRLGVVESAPAKDRRAKLIRLTKRGMESVNDAWAVREKIDRQLSKALGQKNYRRVKENLLVCLKELGGTKRIEARRVREPK